MPSNATPGLAGPAGSAVQFPLCEHLKTNGLRCGSPALRGECYCHAHRKHHMRHDKRASFNANDLPVLEDANAIQVAVMEVLRAVLARSLDPRRAGLLLYGLQIASANLKRVNFEPYELRSGSSKPLMPIPASALPALGRILNQVFAPESSTAETA